MAVGPLDELLAQLHRKVGRGAHDLGLALEIDAQRAFLQGLQLLFFELAALDHLRQHGVAPCLGTLGVEHGVVVGRALEHADQRGAFQHVELVGRLVEIRARGHLDTVGVVEERHGVEVSLQDLVLGVRRLDLERGDRLLELAREGLREHARAPDLLRKQVACQLLRDGGATLRVPAQRVHHRRCRAPPVQTKVVVKTVVFGGDEGVHHVGRYLAQLHPFAVGPAVFGQQLAVHRHELRGQLAFGLADVTDGGGERDQHQRVDQHGGRHGQGSPHQRAAQRAGYPGEQAGQPAEQGRRAGLKGKQQCAHQKLRERGDCFRRLCPTAGPACRLRPARARQALRPWPICCRPRRPPPHSWSSC